MGRDTSCGHWLKKDLIASVKSLFQNISRIKDVNEDRLGTDSRYVKRFKAES